MSKLATISDLDLATVTGGDSAGNANVLGGLVASGKYSHLSRPTGVHDGEHRAQRQGEPAGGRSVHARSHEPVHPVGGARAEVAVSWRRC
jgi:hypothetical protein